MGAAPAILSLLGTGVSAVGQIKQGRDAKDIFEYNQAVAQYQGKLAQDKADIEQGRLERDVKRTISRQRAIAGKSGTVSDSGSNLTTLIETQRQGDLDSAIIRYNADIASWGALNNASLLKTKGQQIETAGFLNAGATLLDGASKWDWKKYRPKTPLVPAGSGYVPSR